VTALAFLMAEWSRTDVDYATRVGHLNGSLSGGLNGSYFLNGTTVFDDGTIDALYGSGGLDWYFAHLSGKYADVLNGRAAEEVVTKI
jgi:hypothetical protein